MNIVFCLAGGGSLGSFQVGVMDALAEKGMDDHASAFTGVSVGALNAALASQVGLGGCHDIWKDLASEDVYEKFGKIRAAYRFLKLGGTRRSRPLYDLVRKHIQLGAGKPSYCGACNIDKGTYETFGNLPGTGSWKQTDYHRALVASAAIPGVVPPVVIGGDRYWDGGVVNITPIGHALSLEPEALVIIACNPVEAKKREPVGGKGFTGLKLAERAFSIHRDEGFLSDYREFSYRNANPGPDDRVVPNVLIEPAYSLGDSDDFTRYDERFTAGRTAGLTAWPEIEAMIS